MTGWHSLYSHRPRSILNRLYSGTNRRK